MLAHVAPRRCIVVHGSAEATAALAGHLQEELAGLLTTVYAPQAGEQVELPAEPSYRLALRRGGEGGSALREALLCSCAGRWLPRHCHGRVTPAHARPSCSRPLPSAAFSALQR